jgi:putative flippase GtrA
MAIARQFSAFVLVGLVAAVAHYGMLIGLVEGRRWPPVPATLCGYVAGGIVSYLLNRRVTFESERAHREAVWRFTAVAGVGFCLTWLAMYGLVDRLGAPYLPAQVLTTGIVLVWSFVAHRLWTFSGVAPP